MKRNNIFFAAMIFFILSIIGCVNVFKMADLTPKDYIYPNNVQKAELLLEKMSLAHKNEVWDSIDTYNLILEEESFGFFGKKSSPFKELKMKFSLDHIPGSSDGMMQILSGVEKGQIWEGLWRHNLQTYWSRNNKARKRQVCFFTQDISILRRISKKNFRSK